MVHCRCPFSGRLTDRGKSANTRYQAVSSLSMSSLRPVANRGKSANSRYLPVGALSMSSLRPVARPWQVCKLQVSTGWCTVDVQSPASCQTVASLQTPSIYRLVHCQCPVSGQLPDRGKSANTRYPAVYVSNSSPN